MQDAPEPKFRGDLGRSGGDSRALLGGDARLLGLQVRRVGLLKLLAEATARADRVAVLARPLADVRDLGRRDLDASAADLDVGTGLEVLGVELGGERAESRLQLGGGLGLDVDGGTHVVSPSVWFVLLSDIHNYTGFALSCQVQTKTFFRESELDTLGIVL